jgi:hypothetical protein
MNNLFKNKYLKYKNKYLELKGGLYNSKESSKYIGVGSIVCVSININNMWSPLYSIYIIYNRSNSGGLEWYNLKILIENNEFYIDKPPSTIDIDITTLSNHTYKIRSYSKTYQTMEN